MSEQQLEPVDDRAVLTQRFASVSQAPWFGHFIIAIIHKVFGPCSVNGSNSIIA